jgi:hypothetical protein
MKQSTANVLSFTKAKSPRPPRNEPSTVQYRAYLVMPCPTGGDADAEIYFENADEASAYDADPDGWAAEYFGLTVAQYYEWLDRDGYPLCAAVTTTGRPCRNVLVNSWRISSAQEFFTLHRKDYCYAHQRRSIALKS